MTDYERLLEQLPPDRRVGAALQLEKLAHDQNSPIYRLYSEVLAVIEAKSHERESRLNKKLEESEARGKQLTVQLTHQLAQNNTETGKALSKGFKELLGKTPLKHLIASKTLGAIIFLAWVALGTPYFVKKQVRTVDPVFHERVSTAESEIKKRIDANAQFQNLRNDQLMDLIRENTDTLKKTHVTTAAETLIGKGIYRYVSGVTEKTMTVEVDGRKITVPHYLSTQDHAQLELALMAIKKAE